MKKRIQILTVLLLSLLLLLSMSNTAVLAEEHKATIMISLQEQMEDSDGPFPVYIMSRLPDEIQGALLSQEWDKARFEEYVLEYQQEIGLEESEPALSINYLYELSCEPSMRIEGQYAFALAAVWLTEEEIYRVISHEKVDAVMDMLIDSPGYRPVFPLQYNADLALEILQISVGLRSNFGLENREWNVNLDEQIDSYDALLALQESVGLIAIAKPVPLRFWEKHDWEVSSNTFLYANDVNGDGTPDDLDIMLKYRNMWV